MPLAEGQRLGPYEVLGRIGAGGMGEVYRARDTRLDRTVALKVLPSEFSQDAALRSRFEREARAISALAHPHICTLFDVGEQDRHTFLVMEHLEGQTLLERIGKGPLPLAQAVGIATQVAEALSAAHKQGIVHRDLKPGNVMLTKAGAKLLDFGLARQTTHGERSEIESLTAAPTKSAPLTGQGTILGTLPYMAPEQVEGKPTDARTDLWALGLLIYEMLTGRRAFEGRSQVSLIGAILEREPEPLGRLQPLTPPSLERLVKRCLAKSPDDRWDTAHDVADELRWIGDASRAAAEGSGRPPGSLRTFAIAVGSAGIVLGVVADRWLVRDERSASPVVRTLLDVQPAEELDRGAISHLYLPTPGGSRTALDWTSDGRALVFVGRRGGVPQLYVRDLGRDEAQPLAGTEGASVPAVSTDGRWVAFWAGGAIKRTPVLGGPISVLASGLAVPPRGMAWGPSGRLYFGRNRDRIWRVAPETVPEPVTTLQPTEMTHALPHVLPGEKALLFTVRRREWTWGDEEVVAQDLATGLRKVLLRDAVDARYVPGGHLVFMRLGVLMAAAFDLGRLAVRGEPTPVLEGVGHALTDGSDDNITGAGQFAVASSGTLAYLPGRPRPYLDKALVTIDRAGRVSALAAPTRSYGALSLAPDGRRLAVMTDDIREQGRWIVDSSRGVIARLPGGGEVSVLRWTPDGLRVAFSRLTRGAHELVWQRADATAAAEVLVRGAHQPSSWSPDGQHLATVLDGDIWIVTLGGPTPTVERLSETTDVESWPEFSPDGRWLAYGSNATGRNEIYVQPWPGRGPREQVSLEGGGSPAWSATGRELFFVSRLNTAGQWQMWAVDVETRPRLRIGTPRRLFDYSWTQLHLFCVPVRCYAVSLDGGRFFAIARAPAPPPTLPVTQIRLVQGWLEDLKTRVGGADPP
jgi:Tol biopolymer transport system component